MKAREVFLIVVLVVSMLLAACGSPQAQPQETEIQESAGETEGVKATEEMGAESSEPIVLGALFPFTGNFAALGNDSFDGVEIARQIINENGGINGRMVEWVKSDAPDATAAASEAERLITQEGVDIIVGSYSSGLALAATAVAERNQKIYWEIGGVADEITKRGFKYTFRTVPNGGQWGETAAEFTAEALAPILGKKVDDLKVVARHVDSDYGVALKEGVALGAEEYGFQLVANDLYDGGATDYSALIEKYKSLNPDVAISSSYTNDARLWQQQTIQLGWTPSAIVGSAGEGHPDFVGTFKEDADWIFTLDIACNIDPSGLNEEQSKLYNEFQEKYKELRGGILPSTPVCNHFMGAWILIKYVLPTIEGDITPDKVRDAALALDIPEGTLWNGWGVKFAGPDDPMAGQNLRGVVGMNQYQDQKLVLVWPPQVATGEIMNIPMPPWDER
jgi:branched-chain amino acid transport system substrate-binding protein